MMDQVLQAIQFVIGKPHKAMAFAYILLAVNMVSASFKAKKLNVSAFFEKIFAYTAFIALGNIVDSVAVNAMFEWEGSTQFLICLYIVSKEAAVLKNYLTQRYGIDIPILNQRLGEIGQKVQSHDPNDLNARIDMLRKELGELEQQQQENPAEDGDEG